MRVLVVEDDLSLANTIRDLLIPTYQVVHSPSLKNAQKIINNQQIDFVVLDLHLADGNGETFCLHLNDLQLNVPILVLTAETDQQVKNNLLKAGIDDYITKPFNTEELLLRIQNICHRYALLTAKELKIDDLLIDIDKRIVRRNNQEFNLSPKEFHLLTFLVQHKNKTLPREVIFANVWKNTDVYESTLDVHIKYLRDKIEGSGNKKFIRTVYGVGYKFESSC